MSLINEKQTKKYVLDRMKELVPYRDYTQISKSFMVDVEASFRNLIDRKLSLVPRTGKTIRIDE